MFSRSMILSVGIVLGLDGLARAEVIAGNPDSDAAALQAVVEQAVERFSQAFKDRDPKALAELFTPEGEYVDTLGTVFHGRGVIEAEYASTFQVTPPGEIEVEIISIRPIAQGVFVEEGVATFHPTEEEAVSRTRYAATHVKQTDGTWLLASLREWDSPDLTPHDRLKTLSWLEGAWREEVGGTSVRTEWKWSEDGNFLISEFSIRDSQGISLKGTQRIGWDGERRQFRSWVFDSTGGSAEGWWAEGNDGTWSVQLSGVDAHGARTSGMLTYFHDGGDGLVVTQEQRTRGGIHLPSITHRIVRQPPLPADRVER